MQSRMLETTVEFRELRSIISELQGGLFKINFYSAMLRECKHVSDFFVD